MFVGVAANVENPPLMPVRVNPAVVHICAFCRKQGHGEGSCWMKNKGKGGGEEGGQLPWMRGPKPGKAKGKGKDKGKAKNKDNWNW